MSVSVSAPVNRWVRVGNINTRFWAAGDKGSCVVLLHGIGGSVENWQLNIDFLARLHRVYALDMVGFGCTDKRVAEYSFSYAAGFVRDFMETQGIERTSLVGNSMGGGIALQFALRFPEKLEKLVLADSACLGKELPFFYRLFTIPIIGELLTIPNRKGIAWLLRQVFYDRAAVTGELIETSYKTFSMPGAQKTFLSALRAGANVLGIRKSILNAITDNLAGIKTPTLIIWGRQDRVFPLSHALYGKQTIPDSELQIIESCGHVPQIERPDKFNTLVMSFLSGQVT